MSNYVDFEIGIGAATNDVFSVQVRSASGFQDNDTLILPINDPRYQNFKMKLDYPPMSEDDVLDLGALLYETLFKGKVWGAFAAARDDAARDGKSLRIKLSIEPDQVAVAEFPWEFACDDTGIPLATEHSFCRFLPRSRPFPALKIAPNTTLKILLTSALPKELVAKFPVDIDAEVAIIRASLKPLEDVGKISIVEVKHLTGLSLQRAIKDEKPHILHYVGHGGFEGNTGSLILEKSDGSRQDFSARQLAIALNGSSVRLVVLNACKTGMVLTNLLRGMAPALMGANIPAVVAMQSSVQDDAGLAFAEEFYRALANGEPIDGCVAEGRKAVIACGLSNLDWGLATLYMRAPDGILFEGVGDNAAASNQPVPNQPTVKQPEATPSSNANVNWGSGNNFSGGNFAVGNVAGGNISQTTNNYGSASSAATPSGSSGPNELQHLISKRNISRQNLYELEFQEAKFTKLYAPVHITNQIRDLKEELAQLDAQIKQLGG